MKSEEPYELPLEIIFTFSIPMVFLFVIMGILFFLFPLISVTDPEAPQHIVVIGYLSPLLGALFLWAPIYQNLLKKIRAVITDETITYYRNKKVTTVNFCDISEITVFTQQSNTFIGIRTCSDVSKIEKGDLSTNFNASMNGNYTLTLPYGQMRSHDKDRIVLTLNKRAAECETAPTAVEESPRSTVPVETNTPKALLVSFLAASVGAFIYFLTIQLLNINIMVLPALLMWGVIHYFGKCVAKDEYTFPLRLWITFLALYMVLTARILLVYAGFYAELHSIGDIISITAEYFSFLATHIGDEVQWIITAFISAVISFFQLSSLGIFRMKQSRTELSTTNQ